MKEKLIYGKKENGKFYVRPVDWSGIWNKKMELQSGNTLYEFDTEEECKKCIEMSEIVVFRMNDYEWWASKLSVEETEEYYEKEVGEENEIEDIRECDIDEEGMWWDTQEESDIKNFEENKSCVSNELKFGNLKKIDNELFKYIPFRLALMKIKEYKEPFCIAATED